jgi:ribonuclease VapC
MILVVDTSAIVAILQDEPEALTFAECLARSEPMISAGTLIETLRVLRMRRGEAATDRVWRLLEANGIEIVSVDKEQIQHADDGMRRFGKGRGAPPAVLNFGDLFVYALARKLDAPLLFKGDDFRQTDLRIAL